MVNVTKKNFIEQSNDLIYHLPNASFIAIDEEMTGITIPSNNNTRYNNRPPRDEPPFEQYNTRLKQVPERYSIVQLGISLFEKVHTDTTTNINNSNDQDKSKSTFVSNPRGYAFDETTVGSKEKENRGYALDPPTTPATATATASPSPSVKKQTDSTEEESEPTPEWKVRRYNFYMFPNSTDNREVVLNPGSISFLQSHNMSLDTWCSGGIPYVCAGNVAVPTTTSTENNSQSTENSNERNCNNNKQKEQKASILFPTAFEAMKRINEYTEKTKKDITEFIKTTTSSSNTTSSIEPSVQSTVRRSVVLTRVDDIAFFARTMAMIREWLDNPVVTTTTTTTTTDGTNNNIIPLDNNDGTASTTGTTTNESNTTTTGTSNTSILLPPCNSFLRRALYENIQLEYPNLITESGAYNQIRVLRLSDEEKEIRFNNTMNSRWNTFVNEKIGMWRIFAAISLTSRGYKIPLSTSLFAPSYQHIVWDNSTTSTSNNNYNNIDDMSTSNISCTQQEQLNIILKAPYLSIGTSKTGDYTDSSMDVTNTIPVIHKQCNPVPIIVHNGFMDLLFLMTHFCCTTLPTNLIDTKRLLLNHFPLIYDTKILATECWSICTDHLPNNNGTNLSSLFNFVAKYRHRFLASNDTTTGSSSSGSMSNNINLRPPSTGLCLMDLIEVVSSTSKQRKMQNSTVVSYGRGNTIEYTSSIQHEGKEEEEDTEQEDQEHEAAYDAYMTGTIFIGLCQLIWNDIQQGKISVSSSSSSLSSVATMNEITKADRHTFLDMILSDDGGSNEKDFSISRHITGRNKLYQMSLYTLDLELFENSDPLGKGMSRQSTYRVSGFDKTLKTPDIVQCLSGLHDLSDRPIVFEILWIDDTSFLAAAIYRNNDNRTTTIDNDNNNNSATAVPLSDDEQQAILQEHGRIVCRALESKFNKNQECVMSLDEYFMERNNAKTIAYHGHGRDDGRIKSNSNTTMSWMDSVLSLIGMNRTVSNDTNEEGPSRKRQRL